MNESLLSTSVEAPGEDESPLLEVRSLGTQIADAVRQDILLGRLRPGEAVSQEKLCARYRISRTPVRDALRRLASEGLVVNEGRRVVVAHVTVSDIDDSFAVTALLHERAARRATRNASASDLDELERLHGAMMAKAAAGDLQHVADLNWQFHRKINLLANSPKLLAMMRTVSLSIPRNYLVDMPQDELARSHSEHEQIIAAMRRGDVAEVETLSRKHVEQAGKRLVARFVETGLLPDEDFTAASKSRQRAEQ
ncbi:GntR family transcriptional regulator [Streptomyces acidicola]|uniref:GntR family transcriptional regulator n=1 Tax=Streptomyces acidicola TaxID=2596892 RepID=UPI00382D3EA1